jgi:FKBP-type peptidyl-prolyl cis-trans isomerase FkpA
MRKLLMVVAAVGLTGCPKGGQNNAVAEPKDDHQKTLYALGVNVGRNLQIFSLSKEELSFVTQGMQDVVSNTTPRVDMNVFQPKVGQLAQERQKVKFEGDAKKNEEILAKAAGEQGATKLESGVIYKELQAGNGASPGPTDEVKVHYKGTLVDGTEFDSSYKRNEPATFPLNGVIPCWTEGVGKMKPGGKAKLTCPPDKAYGPRGSPPTIPPNSVLNFDVELIEVTKRAETK